LSVYRRRLAHIVGRSQWRGTLVVIQGALVVIQGTLARDQRRRTAQTRSEEQI
jgi:hypothetical protein